MRVALYARVSTLNGQNPETQLIELREYAARRGWEAAGEYIDAGVSGSKDSRPSLNRLSPSLPPTTRPSCWAASTCWRGCCS